MNDAETLFRRPCTFIAGATTLEIIPASDLPEVAFAGRSNVGKSSLLNALTNRKDLARTSQTPGRTRQLNFFTLDNRLMLVDLPGYGYAKASKKDIAGWTRLTRDYLSGRAPLRRVFLLIDGRHGLKPTDGEVMALLDECAVPYRIVLTKIDKVSASAQTEIIEKTQESLKTHGAALPECLAVSSHRQRGIDALRTEIASFVSA